MDKVQQVEVERQDGGPGYPGDTQVGPGSAPPPLGVTGVRTGEVLVGVHGLSLTMWTPVQNAVAIVAAAMGVKMPTFERTSHGAQGYETSFQGPVGVRVYGDPAGGGENQSHVVIPGGACEVMGGDGLLAVQQICDRMGIRTRASRVDLAIDGGDYTPADVREAFVEGDVRTYTRRDRWAWHQNGADSTGFTMGSRTSERFARVYDRRGFTRFEVECKGTRAEAIWRQLSHTALDLWPDLIRAHVRDFCDFARPWWEAIMGGTARAMLRLGSFAQATAESARVWMRRQVAPWLAAVVQLDGGSLEFVSELLATGRHRYRRGQLLALQAVMA